VLIPRVQAVIAGGTLDILSADVAMHTNRIVDVASGELQALAPFNDNGQVVPFDRLLEIQLDLVHKLFDVQVGLANMIFEAQSDLMELPRRVAQNAGVTSSHATDSKRLVSKILPKTPDTHAAPFTLTSRARKTSSLRFWSNKPPSTLEKSKRCWSLFPRQNKGCTRYANTM